MNARMQDAFERAGLPSPDRTEEKELRAEVTRLTQIVRKQGKETRRLAGAYKKLKDENRPTHEMLAMAEQLQEEIEALEDSIDFYESDRITQALTSAKKSREKLSIRYGLIHRALTALLADPSARAQAEEALRIVAAKGAKFTAITSDGAPAVASQTSPVAGRDTG